MCAIRACAYTHGHSNSNTIRDANAYTEARSNTKAASNSGAAANPSIKTIESRL